MVFMALIMTVIIGFLGLVVDMSHLYLVKNQLQTAADATALALSGSNCNQSMATTILTMNYADGAPLTTADTLSAPTCVATAPPGSTNYTYTADITVSRSVPMTFMKVLSATDSVSVSARAYAKKSPDPFMIGKFKNQLQPPP